MHALPEFDDAYTPMFRRGQREAVWQGHVAQYYGRDVAGALQWGAPGNMAYHARCKRLAVLRAWTDGMPIGKIESTFTVNPFYSIGAGDIRSIADFVRFHLSAAFEIADVLLLGQGPGADDVERLLAQLEGGIPAAALGLLDLPLNLARGTYLAMHQVGVVQPDAVWALANDRLREIVGNVATETLRAARPSSDGEEMPQSMAAARRTAARSGL